MAPSVLISLGYKNVPLAPFHNLTPWTPKLSLTWRVESVKWSGHEYGTPFTGPLIRWASAQNAGGCSAPEWATMVTVPPRAVRN